MSSSSNPNPQGKDKGPQKPRVYKTNNSLALVNVNEEPIAIRGKMMAYKQQYNTLVGQEKEFIKEKKRLDAKTQKAKRDEVKKRIEEVNRKIREVNDKAAEWKDGFLKDEAERVTKRAGKK